MTATLLVDPQGKVVADSTRIEPAFPAGRYDQRFRERLALMEYSPAALEGCAVSGRTTVEIALPHQ